MKRCEICGDEIPNVNSKGNPMTNYQLSLRKTCNKGECRGESWMRNRTYVVEHKSLSGIRSPFEAML